MKIGFDVSQTGAGKAGCGYFADGMVRELANLTSDQEYVLYPSFGDFYFDHAIQQAYPIDRPGISYGPWHRTLEAATKFWTAADLEHHLGGVDIIHSNNYWCPRQLRTARLIYTLYDLSFLQEPSWTTEANRVGCFHGVFGAAAVSDWIISISHASRDHFLRTFPSYPSDRVKVIYPGSRFVPSGTSMKRPTELKGIEPGNFWLSVGTIEPRKNHDRLLQAFARYLAAGGRPMPLVLAGGKGWLMEEFAGRLAALGISDHVVLTGYITDETLAWLYENCYANIYASLFEGFGLPVLEGMMLGAPTIASRSTSIPEITGAAAILVDPLDVAGLADALLMISNNQELRKTLSTKARDEARHFQWEKSARQLSDLYRLAIKTPKRIPGTNFE
jgi:glycosyltransferase involved in cell wall biosynthesis